MNAKQFLVVAGAVLLLIGMIGFFGIIGPTPEQSVFGDAWWFDNSENWALAFVGVVALVLAYTIPMTVQKWVVMLLGIIGVSIGIYSFFSPTLLGANLENPADSLLHLALGVWALIAALMTKGDAVKA